MSDCTPTSRRIEPRRLLRLLACLPVGIAIGVTLVLGAGRLGVLDFLLSSRISGELSQARSQEPGVRVLLVGNSFTSSNGTPGMVQRLADAEPGGPRMFVVSYTQDGATLEQLSGERRLTQLIGEAPWESVVLQEQSERLSLSPQDWGRLTTPYASVLNGRITAAGAHTVLEMTWGYRDGDQQTTQPDTYAAMQERLEQGYESLGRQLGAQVAPVGIAWHEALDDRPGLDLWADGRHPNREGSYLAACVLYGVLSGRDPRGDPYAGGLSAADASFLQRVAWNAVASAR